MKMAGKKGDAHDSDTPESGSAPGPAHPPGWEPQSGVPGEDSAVSNSASAAEPLQPFAGEEEGNAPESPEFPGSGNDFAFPEDEEDSAYFQGESQLSSDSGVSQDMGTLALEGMPQGRSAVTSLPPSMVGKVDLAPQTTDAEIMLRAAAGDESCFDFLVNKYRRPMIGFMYRMVHNQAVAEELVQEVFLRVYRARASYRAEARFTTWLYRIASNMAINHARDTKHERASSSVYLDQADEETGTRPDIADTRSIVEQDLLRDEKMRQIRAHVLALPERQRMAVVMHKYQDMDYKQIGAVLKLSESATKSLLFRAYQTLRDRLKEFA